MCETRVCRCRPAVANLASYRYRANNARDIGDNRSRTTREYLLLNARKYE